MTESSSIVLAKPSVMAAALPHLLGFHPHESLVCLWMSGNALVVVQRADLPDDMSVDRYLQSYLAPAGRLDCDGVVAVCVTRRGDLAREIMSTLPDRSPVRVRGRCISDGSRVRDATEHGRWTWISTQDRQQASELFAYSSSSTPHGPLRDRAQVLAEVQFDPTVAVHETTRARRPESTTSIAEALRNGPAAIVDDTDLIAHLGGHVEGRDALMWWAARMAPTERRALLGRVLAGLRATPPGRAAHLASLCAAVAWMCGDGVRANAAVDRCLVEDPEHVLGRMIEVAIAVAVAPSSFIEMLEQLEASAVGLDESPGEEGLVDGVARGGYSRN